MMKVEVVGKIELTVPGVSETGSGDRTGTELTVLVVRENRAEG